MLLFLRLPDRLVCAGVGVGNIARITLVVDIVGASNVGGSRRFVETLHGINRLHLFAA